MKFRPGISVLFFSLFVAMPTNPAWACGSDDADHVADYHHAHTTEPVSDQTMPPPAHCADDLDDCGPMHPGEDCPPDPDNCGHCHCPGCGLIGGGLSGGLPGECPNFYRLHPSNDASARRQAFYYAERQPEAVSLPIWQPPKLGA